MNTPCSQMENITKLKYLFPIILIQILEMSLYI